MGALTVWRKETGRGSEFGVRFTALDSRSVQTLKALSALLTYPTDELVRAVAVIRSVIGSEAVLSASAQSACQIAIIVAPCR